MDCPRCGKKIIDGMRIYMKCPGIYEEFSSGVHRTVPETVEDVWHVTCDDEDE